MKRKYRSWQEYENLRYIFIKEIIKDFKKAWKELQKSPNKQIFNFNNMVLKDWDNISIQKTTFTF